jgi:TetR/AcrR family transcriptional repressor of mexJK operon
MQTISEDKPSSRLDHLLAVARREFLTHGYARVSVEGIGKAAGVSKQTIYRHFGDKTDILRAIAEQASSSFQAAASEPVASGDPLDVVDGCVAPIRSSFLTGGSRALFRLTISIASRVPAVAATLNGQFIASLEPIAAQLSGLAERGEIAIDSPLAAAAQLGGLAVEGSLYLMGYPAPPAALFDRHVAAIADLYLNGVSGRTREIPRLDPPEGIAGAAADLHRAIRPYFAEAAEFRLSEGDLQRLVAVARDRFFAQGYREASLDDIGASARIGRGTLYRWFGGKERLFEVAMLHAAAEIGAAPMPQALPGAPFADALGRINAAAASILMSATGTQLYRTMIAEADRLPALARAVHALSRRNATAALTRLLGDYESSRALDEGQRRWLALQCLTLATDGNRYLSVDAASGGEDRDATASRAAAAFLYGHRGMR